jgi:hypothetical protein
MWPFNSKQNVKVKIKDVYSDGFDILVIINGEIVFERYIELTEINAHNMKILKLKMHLQSALMNKPSQASTKTQSSIWHVLGCMPTTDRIVVEKAYRRMAMVYHPDSGGSSGAFQTLTKAKEKALNQCK